MRLQQQLYLATVFFVVLICPITCADQPVGTLEKPGLVEPELTIHNTIHLSVCKDDCKYEAKYKYSWCHTENSWDYCSLTHDVTYKNEPCQLDHLCGTYDQNYSWCYTASDWDYCGVIKTGNHTKKHHKKRALPSFRWTTKEGTFEGTFSAVKDTKDIAETSASDRKNIKELIERWNNGNLRSQAKSNLISLKCFRIDLQGLVNKDNLRYYNLQIQRNVLRCKGKSTTVSQILIPVENTIPDEYVRQAFEESLNLRGKVTVTVRKL